MKLGKKRKTVGPMRGPSTFSNLGPVGRTTEIRKQKEESIYEWRRNQKKLEIKA